MATNDKTRFSVTVGEKPAERTRDPLTDVGHYFDQTVLVRHSELLAARAATLALNDELLRLGVTVDPATGVVTVRRA